MGIRVMKKFLLQKVKIKSHITSTRKVEVFYNNNPNFY
jgi:hypothetical protein